MKLKEKMKKSGGFTLVEMLIVVAIVAILVAISIPVVNTSLEKARKATDAANERAAKMAATIQYLTEDLKPTTATDYFYDAERGVLDTNKPTNGYGKCKDHQGGYVKVNLDEKGTVVISWVDKEGNPISASNHGVIDPLAD